MTASPIKVKWMLLHSSLDQSASDPCLDSGYLSEFYSLPRGFVAPSLYGVL
jgi:hypothetical protein